MFIKQRIRNRIKMFKERKVNNETKTKFGNTVSTGLFDNGNPLTVAPSNS